MKNRYISVSGYGWTGSGACIDILKEFKGFGAPNGEFRIAKDPNGLIDLENSLVHNWDVVRHDVAIKDFINYCKILSRETGLFLKSGKGFSNKLNIDLINESIAYIDKLTCMTYFGDSFVHRYNVPAYKNFIMKIRNKIGKNNAKKMYFARPLEDVFLKETKRYIDNLFCNYIDDNNINTVILDQAIPPTNIFNTSRFFEDIKIIIVDRDPRDAYADMITKGKLFGSDPINEYSASRYIKWHKQLRRVSDNDVDHIDFEKHVLRISFEEIVLNYDKSIKKIINFLDNNDVHEKKSSYFLKNSSIKNIGIWKKCNNQSVMKKIGDELEEYCYNANA